MKPSVFDKLSTTASAVLKETIKRYPNRENYSRGQLYHTGIDMGLTEGKFKELYSDQFKVSRGVYAFNIPEITSEAASVKVMEVDTKPKSKTKSKPMNVSTSKTQTVDIGEADEVFVPKSDSCYIPWGNYTDVVSIIKSRQFYPTFITGLSGNGKTMMVEQACAKLKREYIRVQITPETDEDDLLGGFRLVNGETVFSYGPVVKAMRRGAILLIDEIDRGSNKLMCLQSVLEGKPLLLKKTGELVAPQDGFNIIATANTKGKGSDDGRFTAATILDEAFLERFVDTIEQNYPPARTEMKIVLKHMDKYGKVDEEFADRLITWAEIIRKTFADGGVDEVITTRRLCHITQIFSIFDDRLKSINRGIARFDEETRAAFTDLYTKVDAKATSSDPNMFDAVEQLLNTAKSADDEIPF